MIAMQVLRSRLKVRAAALAAAAIVLSLPAAAQSGAFQRASPPCTKDSNGNCATFVGAINNKLVNLQEFEISFTRPGTVLVSVNGSWTCYSFSSTSSDLFGLIEGQIVGSRKAVPKVGDPGWSGAGIRLSPSNMSETMGDVQSYNLAASRLFTVKSATTMTFYYRARVLVYPDMTCTVRGLQMNASFVPR